MCSADPLVLNERPRNFVVGFVPNGTESGELHHVGITWGYVPDERFPAQSDK